MNVIELFINTPVNAKLDLDAALPLALQYQVADIRDISKRNAAYSKTITLPGTKNNNYWFGNLFDVNSDFTQFNPNKKTDAKLLVNGEIVIDGFLQLRKITKLNNVDFQGNLINYEIVIYNNQVDLMSQIGENTINSLDMSEFGHTFSADNVEASWTHTYQDGYVYPMFGTHTKDSVYSVNYFYPAIFYRTLLDKIVGEAGFGWTGSLANNNQFNHEVISYVSDGRPKIDETERLSREFWVGRTQSITNTGYPFWNDLQNYQYVSSFATARFDDETTSPFFDNGGITASNWDTSTWQWSVAKNGRYGGQIQFLSQLRLWNNNATSTSLTRYSGEDANDYHYWKITAQVEKYTAGAWSVISSAEQQVAGWSGSAATLAPGASRYIDYSLTFDIPEMDFGINDIVRVRYRPTKTAGTWFYTNKITIEVTTKADSWFKNKAVGGEITQNEFVELGQYLPDKVKQKDLLTDLIRRYNLYIQTDPDNPKQLIFDTRPDFYDRGTTIDWTFKKDYSSQDEIELLSDLQFKLMIWTYKSDSDFYNKEYLEATGDIYGQYKYYFDNDFVKNESKIESQFSPTPLVKTPFGAIVPAIDPEKPKVQPRIFYWGGLRDCDGWSWFYQPPTGGASMSETFTQYPYAGHFDDPIEPTININFGNNKFYYYDDWDYITDNNMYNTYWNDYIRQIESGRLVSSYFYLDERDIGFIKDNFYTKIFILDSYYYINKIIDYNPLINGTTKVELIKVVDGIQWQPKRSSQITTKPFKPLFTTLPEVVVGSGNSTTGGTVVIGSGNVVSGWSKKEKDYLGKSYTTIGSAKNITIGDNNIMTGDASMILGDNNSVSTNNAIILGGSNNTIEVDDVILLNTRGITASEPNLIYLGNNFVIDSIAGSFSSPYFSSASASGVNGVDGPSTFRFTLSGITQGIDPGTSSFTIDSTTSTTASVVYVNRYDYLGRDIQSWITTTLGQYASNPVYLQLSQAGTENWTAYEITNYGAYGGGSWFSFDISLLGGFATHSVGQVYSLGLIKNGASASSQNLQQTLALGNTSSLTIQLEVGSVSQPSYSFQSWTQSGLYHSFQHPTTSRVGIAVNGKTASLFKEGGIAIPDGQLLQGGLHFIDDVDTGIYRNTTNELSIVVGGLTAASFYDGSAYAGIKVPVYSTQVLTNTSVTGTLTQSLIDANNYAYTLTGNTTFGYSNATQSVYNFMIKAGTYSFSLNSASNWQTVGATALGYTGSFVMSAIYDGSDMWVSTIRNYQSY